MSVNLKNVAICENVIVSFDGKISIINMFSNIMSKEFPALHPQLTVLVSIMGDSGPHTEIVEIVGPDGKTVASLTDKADIKGDGGNNFIANFVNTRFPTEGQYWVKVTVDGNVLTSKFNPVISLKKI